MTTLLPFARKASLLLVSLMLACSNPATASRAASVSESPTGESPAAGAERLNRYETLWGSKPPPLSKRGDARRGVTLGTRFSPKRNGFIHGARFWRVKGAGGRHPASLWGPRGARLARATFVNETPRGWQRVRFAAPVRVRAGQRYVIAYHAPKGVYAVTRQFSGASKSKVLSTPNRNVGVLRHGAKITLPTRGVRNSNFWVDVLFTPGSAAPSGTCAPVPSACGYPDVTNTGPRRAADLVRVPAERVSGPGWAWNSQYRTVFVSGQGAVLAGLDIAGSVVIDAPNVTLRDSRISACGGTDDSDVIAVRYRPDEGYAGSNARIVHNTIQGTPAGCDHRARSGVRDVFGAAPNVVVDGNDISGSGNGITIEYHGVVTDNWVHDLGHLPDDHHSGISNHGGAKQVTVRHNTVLLHGMSAPGGGGVSGALTVYSDFDHAQNVTLQDNLISGGSYVIYGGNSGDAYSTPSTGIRIVSNRFVCQDWLYGPIAAFDASSPGNEWTDNVCDRTNRPVRP